MSRTTVSLDDDLLRDAQTALGTSGVSSTVNAAWAAAVRQARLAEFDVGLVDITDGELSAARADRLGSEPERYRDGR